VDLLLAIVGAEAGAMALRCLARGGVYIAGGIAPRLLPRIRAHPAGLMEAFTNPAGRPRFAEILRGTPLYVITNTQVGVLGTVQYALSALRQQRPR